MQNKHIERIEQFLDSGTSKAQITKITLCVLAIASIPVIVLVGAAMGNAVQVFKQFETSKKLSKEQITNSMKQLRRKRLIEYVRDKSGKTVVRITKRGISKLRAFDVELMVINKPRKWDNKWRLVMFDIPLRFTKGREALRYHLKKLDFFQFQKSAWIYPYPCEDEIIFIADFHGVGKYVEVLTVENILRDEKIKKHFDLS